MDSFIDWSVLLLLVNKYISQLTQLITKTSFSFINLFRFSPQVWISFLFFLFLCFIFIYIFYSFFFLLQSPVPSFSFVFSLSQDRKLWRIVVAHILKRQSTLENSPLVFVFFHPAASSKFFLFLLLFPVLNHFFFFFSILLRLFFSLIFSLYLSIFSLF